MRRDLRIPLVLTIYKPGKLPLTWHRTIKLDLSVGLQSQTVQQTFTKTFVSINKYQQGRRILKLSQTKRPWILPCLSNNYTASPIKEITRSSTISQLTTLLLSSYFTLRAAIAESLTVKRSTANAIKGESPVPRSSTAAHAKTTLKADRPDIDAKSCSRSRKLETTATIRMSLLIIWKEKHSERSVSAQRD